MLISKVNIYCCTMYHANIARPGFAHADIEQCGFTGQQETIWFYWLTNKKACKSTVDFDEVSGW